jgi:ribosomal protein S18 acetylase RimI-like enzyme
MSMSPTSGPTIRPARGADRKDLIAAIAELQDHERRLHDSRMSGPDIAERYLRSIEVLAAAQGTILVAEEAGVFLGFVVGWIVQENEIAETEDSNRYGCVSDICVLEAHRGHRVASHLLEAIEARLASHGVTRLRLNVLAANSMAQTSYERAGFSPYEIHYEKRIG